MQRGCSLPKSHEKANTSISDPFGYFPVENCCSLWNVVWIAICYWRAKFKACVILKWFFLSMKESEAKIFGVCVHMLIVISEVVLIFFLLP